MHFPTGGGICKNIKQEGAMIELIDKEVEVKTPDIIYRGVLVEIGVNDVHLKSESGWIVVPMDKIIGIEVVDQ